MKKFYITTPIYYINDQPHIGHAYTTIMADIMARFQRMRLGPGNVWFLTGTDEHGAKVAREAEKKQVSPQKFSDTVSAKFKLTWDNLNISNNDFIRTTQERHEMLVKEILRILKNSKTPKNHDVFYEKEYEGLYCVGCEAYLKESELKDGFCPVHKTAPELVSETNWFFRLSDYGQAIKENIEKKSIVIEPDNRKNEVLGLIEQGLEDVAVSRTKVEWGIKIPWDQNQTVYVWIEALLNYITALGYQMENNEKFKKFWPADLQLLAKDILKFHAIIWPALLITLRLDLPRKLFVHGYFQINGQKMSKTLGNVIDPNEMMQKFGSDAVRYLIVSQFPFGQDGDIKAELFTEKYNAELANGIGNLSSRILSLCEKYFNGKIPEPKIKKDVLEVKGFWKKYVENFEKSRVYEVIKSINEFTREIDGYIDENKPWELAKNENQTENLKTVVYNLCESLRHMAWMIYPVLPETSAELLKKLGLEDELSEMKFKNAIKWGAIHANTEVQKGAPLFPRMENNDQ